MDLGDRMGHAEAQILPPLAAGADHPATAIAAGVALSRPPGLFPAGPGGRAGSLGHLDPSAGQGSQRREGGCPVKGLDAGHAAALRRDRRAVGSDHAAD